MIRKATLAVALLACSATAASAEIVFIGKIKFTTEVGCTQTRLHDSGNSVFHPAPANPSAPGANQNFAGLSWVWQDYSLGHSLGGRNFDAVFRTVTTGGVGWGDAYIRGAAQAAQIRIISSVPAAAAITAATQTVTLTGQIKRFANDASGLACTRTFVGNYIKDSRQ